MEDSSVVVCHILDWISGNVNQDISIVEADRVKWPYAIEHGLLDMAMQMEIRSLIYDEHEFENVIESEPTPAKEDTWARMGKAVELAKAPSID